MSDIDDLIARSSIGAGLRNIKENGIEAELADIAAEERDSLCAEVARLTAERDSLRQRLAHLESADVSTRKTLAEARVIARCSDPEWVGDELYRLQGIAAQAETLRHQLENERCEAVIKLARIHDRDRELVNLRQQLEAALQGHAREMHDTSDDYVRLLAQCEGQKADLAAAQRRIAELIGRVEASQRLMSGVDADISAIRLCLSASETETTLQAAERAGHERDNLRSEVQAWRADIAAAADRAGLENK